MNQKKYFIELNNSCCSFGLIKKQIDEKRESFRRKESKKGKGKGTETRTRKRIRRRALGATYATLLYLSTLDTPHPRAIYTCHGSHVLLLS